MFLPFGSLTGVVPVDAVSRGRVLGEFGRVIDDSWRPSQIQQQIHSVIEPGCTASPPAPRPKGDGGI